MTTLFHRLRSSAASALIAAHILAGCIPSGTGTPTSKSAEVTPPSKSTQPAPTGCPVALARRDALTFKYEPHPVLPFWDQQVLLTGASLADLGTVVGTSQVPLAVPGPVDQIVLDGPLPGAPVPFAGASQIYIQLYSLAPGMSVLNAVVALTDAARRANLAVFADPNYLIGYIPTSGDPWTIGGDPWTIGGDTTAPGDPASLSPEALFWRQWALGPHGVGVYTAPDGAAEGRTGLLGDGTTVVVFDTSAFDAPGELHFRGEGWSKAYDGLTLCVSHPRGVPSVSRLRREMRDHGLFVAGLTHAVAPHSRIYLVRTLNTEGQGDLFTLLDNLANYARAASTHAAPDAPGLVLPNTVINLSLGIEESEEIVNVFESARVAEWIRTQLADHRLRDLESSDQTPIAALRTLLPILEQAGAVLVAAAGNDGAAASHKTRPPVQQPASYAYVIGVGASTQNQAIACFSNEGDVYAPGGEGGPASPGTHAPVPECSPMLSSCALSADCRYGLVSMIARPGRQGYAFWTGTSFSTPLVSGMAALALESGIPSSDVPARIISLQNANGVVTVPPEWLTP